MLEGIVARLDMPTACYYSCVPCTYSYARYLCSGTGLIGIGIAHRRSRAWPVHGDEGTLMLQHTLLPDGMDRSARRR